MNRRSLLILFVFTNLLNYVDRYVLAAVLQPLGTELRLDDAQLGKLASMFLIVYMITAPLFGMLSEKVSRTKLVSFGIGLWSIATAGCGLASSYEDLLFARSLVGIGEAAYATLGPAILSDLFNEDERPRAFTWFYMAIPVGTALGYTLGGAVSDFSGWRSAFYIAGVPGLVLAALLFRMKDPVHGGLDLIPDAAAELPYLQKLKLLATNKAWWGVTICATGYTFALGALAHWAPTLLLRKYGISLTEAGTTFGAIAIVTGLIGTFLGGELTARLQGRFSNAGAWVSGLSLLAGVPFLIFTLRAATPAASYPLWFASLLLLFVNTSPVSSINVSCVPASLRATAMAVTILLSHLFGDAISPALVGSRSVALGSGPDSLPTALEITLPAIIVAAISLWWARRDAGKQTVTPA